MSKVYPLIICGGNGTRLWPISRRQSPKQFQRIGGASSATFFQSAVQRHRGELFHDPVIVTGAHHRGTVASQLREIQVRAQVICEPMGRNTGPAVLAAAYAILEQDPDAVFLIIPADHVIKGDLNTVVATSLRAAHAGKIVTFGIVPRYPETGFGYITNAGPMPGLKGVNKVGSFVEKPRLEIAKALVESGTAFWASGISMFRADTIVREYERFDGDSAKLIRAAVDNGDAQPEALYLEEECFAQAYAGPTESIVFEKTEHIALAPLDVDWNDVGSWTAMYAISEQDKDGNVLQGDVVAHNASNTMVRAESRLVSVVGLSDVIIVDTDDALLVARIDQSQDVKEVVEQLKAAHRSETEEHAKAEPTMVPVFKTPAELEKIVGSDRFEIGTAELGVGQSVTLDAGHGKQVINLRGSVHAAGPSWAKHVVEGGRIYSDTEGPIQISNRGEEPAELLFLTMEDVSATPKSQQIAKTA